MCFARAGGSWGEGCWRRSSFAAKPPHTRLVCRQLPTNTATNTPLTCSRPMRGPQMPGARLQTCLAARRLANVHTEKMRVSIGWRVGELGGRKPKAARQQPRGATQAPTHLGCLPRLFRRQRAAARCPGRAPTVQTWRPGQRAAHLRCYNCSAVAEDKESMCAGRASYKRQSAQRVTVPPRHKDTKKVTHVPHSRKRHDGYRGKGREGLLNILPAGGVGRGGGGVIGGVSINWGGAKAFTRPQRPSCPQTATAEEPAHSLTS